MHIKKSQYKMIYKFAGEQIYIGGNKNSSDILENIDKVIEEYDSQKYNPIEKLHDKYFDEDYNKNLIRKLILSTILFIFKITRNTNKSIVLEGSEEVEQDSAIKKIENDLLYVQG